MANERQEVDSVTGTATTGHSWDGIRELNTPLPRWWLWMFYATIVWSIGYWIAYPAWPLVANYTRGGPALELARRRCLRTPGTQRAARADGGQARRGLAAEIAADPRLDTFARAQGRTVFAENCAPCHGAGGGGGRGYPNLNDDDWIWGGKLDDIARTIRHGARAQDPETRQGVTMPAFGRDGLLKGAEIEAVADYVRSLSGLHANPGVDVAAGKKVFESNCAVCHGEAGKGNRDVGAPNLTDAIWLYGSERAAIIEGITNGRGGVMPAWAGRLDDTTIKALAVYVHALGGGEN